MEEIEISRALVQENLFELFKQQLKKDFESAGLNTDFMSVLPQELAALKHALSAVTVPLIGSNFNALSSLLYRVDISERQLSNYQQAHQDLPFELLVAELIIKRELQKIILKKTFSK